MEDDDIEEAIDANKDDLDGRETTDFRLYTNTHNSRRFIENYPELSVEPSSNKFICTVCQLFHPVDSK